MSVGAALRRLGDEKLLTAATLVTVLTALTLLAAGPIYADAVSEAALRHKLETAPPLASSIEVSVSGPVAVHHALNRLADEVITSALGPVDAATSRRLVAGSLDFDDRPQDDELTHLVLPHFVEGIPDHSTLIEGGWPALDAARFEVAIDQRVASNLDLSVGQTVSLSSRGGDSAMIEALVVGEFRIDDPTDRFWVGLPILQDGVVESRLFRTFAFVTSQDSLLEAADGRIDLSWRSWPNYADVRIGEAEQLGRSVQNLEARLTSRLDEAFPETGDALSAVTVTTGVPALVDGASRSIAVTRSNVLSVVFQLALLAAYSLVHLSGWTLTSRAAQAELLRARGATPADVGRRAIVEALLYVVPAVIVAPLLASTLVGRFDEFGALSAIDLDLQPAISLRSYAVVALAGVAMICLTAWPVFRAARSADQASRRGRRQRSRTIVQRVGADVVLVVLAGVLVWQLDSLGSDRVDVVDGRFSVDPLLVIAPVVTMAAGAVLALRVVPFLVRGAERIVIAGRSAVSALVAWQMARRPNRYAQSSLLLILAVSTSVFAASYQSTWERSQQDQATEQVGADVHLRPNRRVNDSIGDLHLVSAHEAIDGVISSIPARRTRRTVGNDVLPTTFVSLDAGRAPQVLQLRDDARPALVEALSKLADRRPAIPAVRLDGRPVAIALDIEVTEEEIEDADGVVQEAQFAAVAVVTVQDGHGRLHRLPFGSVVANEGPTTLIAELESKDAQAVTLAPAYPLSIVDIEFRVAAPTRPSGDVTIRVTDLRTRTEAETSRRVGADLGAPDWRSQVTLQGRLTGETTLLDTAAQPETGRRLLYEPGWSRTPVVVLLNLRPNSAVVELPDAIPVAVTARWMAENDGVIGDRVDVSAVQALETQGEIVAVIDRFPTVDPARSDVVLLDLATVQLLDFEAGRPVRQDQEYWLALENSDVALGSVLAGAPFESVETTFRAERLTGLLNDAPALGFIGALTAGAAAAVVFAVVGVTVSFVLSMHERKSEFVLLEALGLSIKQRATWLLVERAALTATGIVIGTALGLVMSAIVLPLISVTQSGQVAHPDLIVRYPWATIAGISVTVVGALAAGAGSLGLRRDRHTVAEVARVGEAQ